MDGYAGLRLLFPSACLFDLSLPRLHPLHTFRTFVTSCAACFLCTSFLTMFTEAGRLRLVEFVSRIKAALATLMDLSL